MNPIELHLPFPPSVNHYWRHWRGRTVLSEEGRRFRERVRIHVALHPAAMRRLEGELSIEIEVFPPDRRRRDLDNLLKGLLDALQHAGVYLDDAQIRLLQMKAGPPHPPDGHTHVRLASLEPAWETQP